MRVVEKERKRFLGESGPLLDLSRCQARKVRILRADVVTSVEVGGV